MNRKWLCLIVSLVQCSRWTAFSCLFTHPNVKGPHFFRRAVSYGRIKVPQVVKVLTYKELNPIIRTPLLQGNGVPGTPFLLSPAQTLWLLYLELIARMFSYRPITTKVQLFKSQEVICN